MSNKVKYGLKNVYYAVATDDGTGTLTYATPKPWRGAVNLSLDAQGDTNEFYADNILYFSSTANNGYQGDFECALIPDSFREEVLGETKGTDNVYVEAVGAPVKEFALLFQFEGDANATRHVLYRCIASRPQIASQTIESSIEPVTETIQITAMPRISDNLLKARCDSASTAYANWFTEVYEG